MKDQLCQSDEVRERFDFDESLRDFLRPSLHEVLYRDQVVCGLEYTFVNISPDTSTIVQLPLLIAGMFRDGGGNPRFFCTTWQARQ